MDQLAHEYQRFEDAGVGLVILSVDSIKRERQMADSCTHRPSFPILSDIDHDTTVAYNVFQSGIAIPSTFLIDRHGVVRWVYLGSNPSDRPLIDQLLKPVALV